MKFILHLFLIASSVHLIGQVTLTSSIVPEDGDLYSIYTFVNPTQPQFLNNSGPNQYWDFSTMNHTDGSIIEYFSLSSPDFPESNMGYYFDGQLLTFNVSDSLITYFGSDHQLVQLSYSDGAVQLKLPLHYQNIVTDSFNGILNQYGDIYNIQGSRQIIANSWGTLVVPGKTYTNTLRLLQVDSISMTQGSLSINYIDSSYIWYSNNYHNPLLEFKTRYSSDGTSLGSTGYFLSEEHLSTISKNKETNKLYPNPSKDQITVECIQPNCFIIIYNSVGKKIIAKYLDSQYEKLTTSMIPKGVYYYEIRSSSNEILAKDKLIIQ